MALLEAASMRLSQWRARKEPKLTIPTPEVITPEAPLFSPTFLAAQERQAEVDARFAQLTPTGPAEGGMFGQDKLVKKVPTTDGEVVVKTFKPTSRFNLIYGLGYPAESIPGDTDKTGERERMAALPAKEPSDPEEVAEKVRLTHTIATAYMGEGGLIVPTATMVDPEGNITQVQKYLPSPDRIIQIDRDPREVAIQTRTKVELFKTLQERWKSMLTTPDFKALPDDVQDYWRTYSPDSGYGSNAYFLGMGRAVAIDY